MVDAAVVCRPNQLREAAVVLSVLPREATCPLIVIEPPPVSQAAYRELYLAYREIADARDRAIGAAIGRAEVLAGKVPAPPSNEDVDARTEALTPYRNWVKRVRALAALLASAAPQRAIVLFEPGPEDLSFLEPMPVQRLSDRQYPLIPQAARVDVLAGAGATPLVERAWALLRKESFESSRANAVSVTSTPAGVLAGFYRAREAGVPLQVAGVSLQVTGDLEASDPQPFVDPPDVASVPEAVLVEALDDAEMLLGVAYALKRRARLVVCEPPEIAPIEAARSAAQRWRDERAAKSTNSAKAAPVPVDADVAAPASGDAALAALEDALFAGSFENAIEDLERAVSAAVPDEVVAAVGERRLTAVTRGVPYTFVKKPGADWSSKPIGHVTGDISLLLLPELLIAPADAGVGFNLLVDPGFFATTETIDVLTELGDRSSFPIVTSGDGGSSLACLSLARDLPLDLVFFNTHGSDGAIVFREGPLPAYKILQRFTFPSRPIVFNNSCQSWVGVGRAFLRAGARGYVGTLWSVDAVEAAALAKTAIGRMVHANAAISDAVLATGAAENDSRAYLFVGPVDAKLAADPPAGDDARRTQLFASAQILLSALQRWVGSTGTASSMDFVNAPTAQLWAAVKELNARIVALARPGEDVLPLLDLAIQQLLVNSLLAATNPDNARAGRAYLVACEQLFALVPDATELAKRKASAFQYASRLPPAWLAPRTPASLLTDALAAAKAAGISAGPQLLEWSDLLRVSGDYAGALKAADDAVRAYDDAGDDDPAGAILALGRLTQITLRTDVKAALGYARDGFARALAAEDRGEQASFKNDEARALLALAWADRDSDVTAALACARAAVDAARLDHNDDAELKAYGVLVGALIRAGKLDEARAGAEIGYSVSAQLGDRVSVGDYLNDLGTIEAASGPSLAALEFWRRAAYAFAGSGRLENETKVLTRMEIMTAALDTPPAHAECMTAIMVLIDDFSPDQRSALCTTFVGHLKSAIGKAPFEQSSDALRQLAAAGETAAQARGGGCEQLTFMRRAVDTCRERASGATADALAHAALLDAMSNNGFGLVSFIAAPSG